MVSPKACSLFAKAVLTAIPGANKLQISGLLTNTEVQRDIEFAQRHTAATTEVDPRGPGPSQPGPCGVL